MRRAMDWNLLLTTFGLSAVAFVMMGMLMGMRIL
jgi:hypothetical protein